MRVSVNGQKIELTQRNFVAKGGEAKVYAKGDTAFKIYHDPANMIPEGKIRALGELTDPRIIKPDDIIMQDRKATGFTMKLLPDATPLCALFTRKFKRRNKVHPKKLLRIVKRFRELLAYIHSKDIIVADVNENNFLIDTAKFHDIYAIDVNGYQPAGWRMSWSATPILPTVRDYHTQELTFNTDWFSWGVIAFWMLINYHPYKGNHPTLGGQTLDETVARMQRNVSLFNPDVKFSSSVAEPFDSLPDGLREWFYQTFEKGVRTPPPDDFDKIVRQVVAAKIKKVTGSNMFVIEDIYTAAAEILSVSFKNRTRVLSTTNGAIVNNREYKFAAPDDKRIAFAEGNTNKPIAVWIEDNHVKLWDITAEQPINYVSEAQEIMSYKGDVFVRNGSHILRFNFREVGNRVLASAVSVGHVLDLPHATRMYNGVVAQNLLGRWHFNMFEDVSTYQLAIPEFDNYDVMEAKYEHGVLVVLLNDRKGQYSRVIVKIASDFRTYEIRWDNNISVLDINFAVNEKGVAGLLNDKIQLEIFVAKLGHTQVNVVEDNALHADMRLTVDGAKFLFTHDEKLCSITMAKK